MQNQMTVVPAAAPLPVLVTGPGSFKKDDSKKEIRFIHLRHHSFRNVIDKGEKKGTVEARGGVTIAYVRAGDTCKFSWAQCCTKDVFSRKIGRSISTGRLLGGDGDVLEIDDKMTRTEVCKALINTYYDYESAWWTDVDSFVY